MNPWRQLGLAPTDDARAIRRAYATRLKALDPDDRDGFMVLRAALDAATNWWCGKGEEDWLDVTAPEAPVPAAPSPSPPPSAGPVALAAGVSTPPGWQDEAAAIEALVWAGCPVDLDARRAADEALAARAERLFATPALEDVGEAQAAESWLADLIVDAMPRADALIGPGLRRFGWERQARRWDCAWAVKRAIQRRVDIAWLSRQPRLSTVGQGWAVLTDPERYPPRANEEGLVTALLREIDAHHPTLRTDLDETAVAAWEGFLAKRRERPLARFDRRFNAAMRRVGHLLLWPLRRVHPGWPVTPFRLLWALFIIVQVARCAAL